MSLRARSSFVVHGAQHRIGRRRLRARATSDGQPAARRRASTRPSLRRLLCLPCRSARGSSGGRSFDLAFFSISISETRIAGETADTGTLPDSAPQYPLNTSGLSPVARILAKLASGVPTMSAPRTSSSGRPSGYTRYTITGITLKACKPARAGGGEAAGDVVEVEPVRLVLPLHLVDQHLAQPGLGDRVGRFHNQVRLPRNHFVSRLAAPVAVGMVEALNRRARHQEGLQHALVHRQHRPRLHALVVVIVPAVQVDAADFALAWDRTPPTGNPAAPSCRRSW